VKATPLAMSVVAPRTHLTALLLVSLLHGCGGDGEEETRSGPSGGGAETQERGELSREAPVHLELEATYPEGFSFLNSVREMPDGSVLAADPLAQTLLRIGPDLASSDTLGRVGPGPQEYEQPDGVFPLPGDSSLLVDLGKMQLTTILPDGRFGSGTSMSLEGDGRFPLVFHPRFADLGGRIYDGAPRSREGGPADSAAVIRLERGTAALDTVGVVWLPEYRPRRTRNRGFLPTLLQPADDWAVGPDGALAVVRAHGFSVDWFFPDGEVVQGPPHDFEVFPVTRADQEAVLLDARNSGISMTAVAGGDGSVSRMTMSRGLPPGADQPDVSDYDWADVLPGFQPGRARISAEGELWVERFMPAGRETRWEVFDQAGRWLGSVTLPPRYQLIGFGRAGSGNEVAYLARTDDFELKWLERFRVVR
jgi:hypothetical protein